MIGPRRALLFFALGMSSVWARGAAQAPPLAGVSVQWEAPSSCPASAEVLQRARQLLGPDFRHTGELEVEIEIEPQPEGFTLRLEVAGDAAEGERELQLASCEEVRAAAGLLIALVLDPDLQHPIPEPEPDPAPDPAPDPPLVLRWELGPSVGVDTSLLPGVALALGAQLALTIDRMRAELGALYLLPRSATATEPAPQDVPIDALGGRARLGFLPFSGRGFALGPFAGLLLARLAAHPEPPGAESGGALLLSPEVGGLLELRLGTALSLRLSLCALIPTRRPRFALRSNGREVDLYAASGFSALAEAALLFRL